MRTSVMLRPLSDAIHQLRGSSFGLSVLLLSGGTAVAQLIGFAAAPVLTRLYRPSDFGLLAIQAAAVAIITAYATGRYEFAVPLAQDRIVAMNAAVLAFLCLIVATIVTGGILYFAWPLLERQLGIVDGRFLLWMILAGVMVQGTYEVLTHVALRRTAFRALFGSRISQATAMAGLQLVGGTTGVLSRGLLLGDVGGRAVAVLSLAFLAIRDRLSMLREVTAAGLLGAAKTYKRFPTLYMGATLLNLASAQITPVIVAILYSSRVAGLFALAYRVVFLPMALIGSAIAQPLYATAPRLRETDPHGLARMLRKLALILAAIATIPAAIIWAVGPALFELLFSKPWRDAGQMARFVAVIFVVQFVYSPLSPMLNVLGRQDVLLWWSGALLTVSVGSLYAGSRLGSIWWALGLFAVTNALAYLAALWLLFRVVAADGRRAQVAP